MIPTSALDDLRAKNPVPEIAGKRVSLHRAGRGLAGPCLICSLDPMSKTAARFECDADHWSARA